MAKLKLRKKIYLGPWAGPLLERVGCTLPLSPMKIPVYYWQVESFLPHTFIYEGRPHLQYTTRLNRIKFAKVQVICHECFNLQYKIIMFFEPLTTGLKHDQIRFFFFCGDI